VHFVGTLGSDAQDLICIHEKWISGLSGLETFSWMCPRFRGWVGFRNRVVVEVELIFWKTIPVRRVSSSFLAYESCKAISKSVPRTPLETCLLCSRELPSPDHGVRLSHM
jgi:hypothetical protein